jgi:hypothetical protein
VNVKNPKASWAHYNVFSAQDDTQKWRWANIKLTTFPTIIVQPPRSGEYGSPATVATQISGYDGVAERLAGRLKGHITEFAQTHSRRPLLPRPRPITDYPDWFPVDTVDVITVDQTPTPAPIGPNQPPFITPDPIDIDGSPTVAPSTTVGGSFLTRIFSGIDLNTILIATIGILFLRSYRQSNGLGTIIDADTFRGIIDTIIDVRAQVNRVGESTAKTPPIILRPVVDKTGPLASSVVDTFSVRPAGESPKGT